MNGAAAQGRRIAIIGGGIAGLTCGHLLHPMHQVTLFEKAGRVGGNAITLDTRDGSRFDIAVAIYSSDGYRNFFRLLARLGMHTSHIRPTFISMENLETREGCYLTPTLSGLVAQKLALLRPSTLLSLLRVLFGIRRLQRLRASGELDGLTLREALSQLPAISGVGRDLLLCSLCLMSSQECEDVLDAPASFFVAKLAKYSDVVTPRALWSLKCMRGGTRVYIEALADSFRERIHLDAQIATVRRDDRGVVIVMEDGSQHPFDEVIFACNADQALALLEAPTARERELLGAWRYRDGRVVVHQDHSSFPRRELIQGYTFLYRPQGQSFTTSVSGAVWALPGVDPDCNWISSQHPNFPIRDDLIEFDTVLRTPIFEKHSCATISQLPSLNGVQHSWFCGSHFGFGLHEDAITSALAVTEAFGARL